MLKRSIRLLNSHWKKLIVFGLIGYGTAIPRALILTELIAVGMEENTANFMSLILGIWMSYTLNFFTTWRQASAQEPWYSKRNGRRYLLLFGPFLGVVGTGAVLKILSFPLIHYYLGILPYWIISLSQDTLVGFFDYALNNVFVFGKRTKVNFSHENETWAGR